MPEIKALVTSNSCPHCAGMKKYLEKKGLLDKVKIITFETPEGHEFCKQNNITAVPECVIIKGEGKDVHICSEEEFQKLLEDGS